MEILKSFIFVLLIVMVLSSAVEIYGKITRKYFITLDFKIDVRDRIIGTFLYAVDAYMAIISIYFLVKIFYL